MTMVVRVIGGVRGKIMASMIIFTNATGAYSIQGVRDNVPGITYRSSPKGWMNMGISAEYFVDPIAYQGDRYDIGNMFGLTIRQPTILHHNCNRLWWLEIQTMLSPSLVQLAN
jgi:hypothetical protein